MKATNSYRARTDIKSTELSESPSQPDIQQCMSELQKYLHSSQPYPQHPQLLRSLLISVLRKLALQPQDILPIDRHRVAKESKKQTRQLMKQDVKFYLDNKCLKLQARRKALLKEVVKEYQRMNTVYTMATNFMSLSKDQQPTKRNSKFSNRYQEQDEAARILRNQQNRMRIVKNLRVKYVSDDNLRLKMSQDIKNKQSSAEVRRRQYKLYVESMRSSPIMSPQQVKRNRQKVFHSFQRRRSQIQEQIQSKQQRASKSRAQRKRSFELNIHHKNQQIADKSKSIKYTLLQQQMEISEILREQMQQSMKTHIEKKTQIVDEHIKYLKSKKQFEQRRVERVKQQLKHREQIVHQKKLKAYRQKQQIAQKNKSQMRMEMQEALRQRQRIRQLKISNVYRKKSFGDIESQRRRNQLLKYRIDTENMVEERKRSLEVQRRRGHILQQIKLQISALNIKRYHKLQEIKVNRTKQQLQIVDKKYKEMEQKKYRMAENRQRLRTLILRRKQNLQLYFQPKTKDFTSLTPNKINAKRNPMSSTIDLQQIQKTKQFVNISADN